MFHFSSTTTIAFMISPCSARRGSQDTRPQSSGRARSVRPGHAVPRC
jgi:hypothetical protein